MEESFSEIIGIQLKKLLPLLCSVALVLFSQVPVHLPLFLRIRPDFGIICVFFWALYRQDLFNFGSAFVLGLIADSVSTVPLGLNIFVYLFIFTLCSSFGRFFNMKPFTISWLGFATISLTAFIIKWLIASVYYRHFLNFGGIFNLYITTFFGYPLIARLNMYIQNRFLIDEGAVYEQG